MSMNYYFDPTTIDIDKRNKLRTEWLKIPDDESREIIIIEHQYLLFQFKLLNQLKTRRIGNTSKGNKIFGGLRVGIIKAILLITASIAEEALLSHAIVRRYELPEKNNERTLGPIIYTYKHQKWEGLGESIGRKFFWLMNERNHVHLHRIIEKHNDYKIFYKEIEKQEDKQIKRAQSIINALQKLESIKS